MMVEVIGETTEAFGANPADMDTMYSFRYKVLDVGDLVASHDANLQPNPLYPQELQPRLRDRAASKIQVDTIARNLNPRALLHDSGFIDTGPMIVGDDDVVESGNGRILALRLAMTEYPDRYKLYKDILIKNATKYGLDQNKLQAIKNPVLVRERLTDVDRVVFASEANVGAVMGMSPYEQALQDAQRLSDNIMSTLFVGEDQSIDQALKAKANGHIVSHFIATVPVGERAKISEAKGDINQQGLQRLKLAIFAKTYTGDSGKRLVRIFGENVDPVIKSIENAMFQSLPDMAKAEMLIDAGQRDNDYSIAADMAEAIDTYASLKQSGLSVRDYLAQMAMFEERLNPFQKQLLEHLDDISKKPKLVREMLRDIGEKIVSSPAKGQISLMGITPLTREDIVYDVINKQRKGLDKAPFKIASVEAVSPALVQPIIGGIRKTERVGEKPQRRREKIKRVDRREPTRAKELKQIHQSRSDRAREADERLAHSVILETDDLKVGKWEKNPGSADIRGIDTLKSKKKPKPKRKQYTTGLQRVRV